MSLRSRKVLEFSHCFSIYNRHSTEFGLLLTEAQRQWVLKKSDSALEALAMMHYINLRFTLHYIKWQT